MLYHCGLLSEHPEKDATLAWVRRGGWDLPGTPPEIEYERRVWLAMPGFTAAFHTHNLWVGPSVVKRHMGRDYADLKDEVVKNWLSCTREDAVKLSHLRPSPHGHMPVICQVQLLRDIKDRMKQVDLANEYGVHLTTIKELARGRIHFRGDLPSGFEWLRA
jgi:hypothetical protein